MIICRQKRLLKNAGRWSAKDALTQVIERSRAMPERELDELRTHSNPFHHNTNPSGSTGPINETELSTYVKKSLAFVSRGNLKLGTTSAGSTHGS